MSTQTTFDLIGLSRAISARDCRYHSALYAADAQVEILDAAHADAPLQVLHGKPAIEAWLDARSSAEVHCKLKDAVVRADRVSYTEECCFADGSKVLLRCGAQVHRGQITSATVRLVIISPEKATSSLGQAGRTRTTGHEPRRVPSPQGLRREKSTRQVAGNFLG